MSESNKLSAYEELSMDESERRRRYGEFVGGMLREREAMKGEMNKRVVYGSDDFIEKVTAQYKVGAVIKPIGRPKIKIDKIRTVPLFSENICPQKQDNSTL